METKLDIKTEINGNSVVITNLTGTAAKQIESQCFKLDGNIESVSNYLEKIGEKGRQNFNPVHSCIKSSEKQIDFKGNANTTVTHSIIGRLDVNPEIKNIGVNADVLFNAKELEKKIRFMKHLFENENQFTAALTAIRDVKIKIDAKIENVNDRNQKKNTVEQTHDFKAIDFIMKIPLFVGDIEPSSFPVSIFADITTNGAQFWFECVELQSLIEEVAKKRISAEIEKLKAFEFPIIYS